MRAIVLMPVAMAVFVTVAVGVSRIVGVAVRVHTLIFYVQSSRKTASTAASVVAQLLDG
jgi:hypothetical protein